MKPPQRLSVLECWTTAGKKHRDPARREARYRRLVAANGHLVPVRVGRLRKNRVSPE